MRKFIYFITIIFLITGCSISLNNTPTKQVELMLADYQTLNKRVLDDLDDVIEDNVDLVGTQKEEYRQLMKKHYKDIIYDVKEERINGDEAVVSTEIDVLDYTKALSKANTYLQAHPEEFTDSNGNYDNEKFVNYRLKQLKEVKDRVKYTLDIKVSKVDNKWKVDNLSEDQLKKLHGIYKY